MSPAAGSGAERLVATLETLGVRTVFGVPGEPGIGLFEALRKSRVRTVLTTHELGAAFAANGYYRASGEVGTLVTVPGPGFAYALPGLAEARADSAALLHLALRPAPSALPRFQLQYVDQEAIARPLVKAVVDVAAADHLEAAAREAYACATAGEPGPVLLHLAPEALSGGGAAEAPAAARGAGAVDRGALDRLAGRLAAARRPILFAGQGTFGAARELVQLAERLAIPVFTTPSGRGVIREDHPLALGFDAMRGDAVALNALLADADLILSVGCKLGHNGTVGFALHLPPERLVQVNADREALGATYAASLVIEASAEAALAHLLRVPALAGRVASSWDDAAVRQWRERLRGAGAFDLPEPAFPGVAGGTAAAFFAALRRALPREAIVVTDSGLHQVLTRRYYDVFTPRGLIAPSDFQSMGFGIPAAIGARLAAPARPVVAVVGDGGLLMAGMELATAVREHIRVTVIVFNDGQLNQIRLQQLARFGHAHGVALATPDLEAFAAAVGAGYVRVAGDAERVLRDATASERPTLVEVLVGDAPAVRALRFKARAKGAVRGAIGERAVGWIKRWLGRGPG